ncbi:hypothetical protein Cgig2_014248 [Carnegiea gigantea]|uniref:Uncharacterized protein n=1 Tax=Carnegiea gigantea TaxID=171969 RepID=A0A9Q1K2W7_9CARY|nr:hypothetical protein Cgig2_014248 [Carnegiea gigantea]
MVTTYDCDGNHSLNNLYLLREKWCPTFSKKNFSGGVLSLQRSESTNISIKRWLHATVNLCDFYNIFCGVVSEWREKENSENHKCFKGNVEMAFPWISLLKHTGFIYTIETYRLFEKEFIKGTSYDQDKLRSDTSDRVFRVSRATNLKIGKLQRSYQKMSQVFKNHSRGSLIKDPSGGLLLQVCYERFYNSICTITILIMNNVAHRYVIVAFSTLLQNGVPLCMNVSYGGSSSQGNVVPTLNLLSNSNPNDQSLRQSTIAAIGYCRSFYFDPRTAGGLTPMMFQSFIGQTPINGACNQSCNNDA